MFCPRCSAENNSEQKYCRQCGLPLTAARTALTGALDEALKTYKKGANSLSRGSVFLILSVMAALANILLMSGPWNYGVIINLLIGLLITVPMIVVGIVRLRGAQRVLQLKDGQGQLESDYSQDKGILAASAHSTGRLLSAVEAPDSIAEGTTRSLTTPERRS